MLHERLRWGRWRDVEGGSGRSATAPVHEFLTTLLLRCNMCRPWRCPIRPGW
ncbi:hypothetical protein STRNTR1_3385 [Stenotrophomonas maltophilia]|nr:hypothetical protein STRNTR1_3385 [Stenotrophomonas maltophilia]